MQMLKNLQQVRFKPTSYESTVTKEKTLVKVARRNERFFHWRKLINVTMILGEFCLKSMCIVISTGRNTHA